METSAFCLVIGRAFNRDRYDVAFARESFGRHERVVITATCQGCGEAVSRPVIPTDLGRHEDQYCEDTVSMMEDALRDRCRCWEIVERRTVHVRPFESIPFPKSIKKPMKPVVKAKLKIRRKIR